MTIFNRIITVFFLIIFIPQLLFARYYDTKVSRWISIDPILSEYLPENNDTDQVAELRGYGGVYNPINLNLYNYTYNNPVKYTDPDGNSGLIFFAQPNVAPTPLLLARTPIAPRWATGLTMYSRPIAPNPSLWARFSNWFRSKFGIGKPKGGYGSGRTKAGIKREPAIKHWKKQLLRNRRDLSRYNRDRIKNGKSPKVDKQWSKYHPKDKPYQGDKIEIHHKNHGSKLKEMAKTRHRGSGNYKKWHNTKK